MGYELPYDLHFNSIKVQLKHSDSATTVPEGYDFNSIKVQLKHITMYQD